MTYHAYTGLNTGSNKTQNTQKAILNFSEGLLCKYLYYRGRQVSSLPLKILLCPKRLFCKLKDDLVNNHRGTYCQLPFTIKVRK